MGPAEWALLSDSISPAASRVERLLGWNTTLPTYPHPPRHPPWCVKAFEDDINRTI